MLFSLALLSKLPNKQKKPAISTNKTPLGNQIVSGTYTKYRKIYPASTTLTVLGSTFDSCYTHGEPFNYQNGGAIYLTGSSTLKMYQLTSYQTNEFINCYAQVSGGALFIFNSAAEVYDAKFKKNVCGGDGGAIFHNGMRYRRVSYDRPQLYNKFDCQRCYFSENSAGYRGGAITVEGATDVAIKTCSFLRNICGLGGSALYSNYCDLILTDNKFVQNYVDSDIPRPDYSERNAYTPAGAVLIRSHQEGYPVWVTSRRNCYNGNEIRKTEWADKSKLAQSVLCLWSVHYDSVDDRMKYGTAKAYTVAITNWYPKFDMRYLANLVSRQLQSWSEKGLTDNIVDCQIDGIPYVPPPTQVPPRTAWPTKSAYPTLWPTKSAYPTPAQTKHSDTPARTRSPDPTVAPPPTPDPTEAPPQTPRATIFVQVLTPEPTANFSFTPDPNNSVIFNQTQLPTISISRGSVIKSDRADHADGAQISNKTEDKPDDSVAGLVIAAVAGVAAVGLIAGVIYALTKPSPPPFNLESAENADLNGDNPTVTNDNPIYNTNAQNDPFASEFDPV